MFKDLVAEELKLRPMMGLVNKCAIMTMEKL
jgi:hypothetical protein